MATLAQLRTRVDDWLAARWPTVRQRQAAYYAAHGRYAQFLWSHTAEPEHSASRDGDTEPDNLSSKPTDQAESWLDLFSEFSGVSIAAAIKIDVYRGPAGDGFVATVAVRFAGTRYERAQNYGPEGWRTHGWRVAADAAREAALTEALDAVKPE